VNPQVAQFGTATEVEHQIPASGRGPTADESQRESGATIKIICPYTPAYIATQIKRTRIRSSSAATPGIDRTKEYGGKFWREIAGPGPVKIRQIVRMLFTVPVQFASSREAERRRSDWIWRKTR
jgi:hypothetical protein